MRTIRKFAFLSFPKHISENLFYRTDATTGFANEAATYLIWPLFANEMTAVGVWIANLEKNTADNWLRFDLQEHTENESLGEV